MDWIETLRRYAGEHGQSKAGEVIGYSAAVVNQVLKGAYKGNVQRVEEAVRGALQQATVTCPVLGELPRNQCLEWQREPLCATNPLRVDLYRTCKTCPNRLFRSEN